MMRRRSLALVVAASASLMACGAATAPTTSGTPVTSTTTAPDGTTGYRALQTLLEGASPLRRFSLGTDRLGVWICHVPVGVTDPIYNPVDLRLDLEVRKVAALLSERVSTYFTALTHGAYVPEFVPEGEVTIAANETNRTCVDRAAERSASDIDGLVVIADAEHAEDQHGGWGRTGEPCEEAEACPARVSGRAAYVGASDFHPDWGAVPAVDLLEHEIGHTLGFPHSGGGNGYTSAIDVMSNSAAPRNVDPNRRDGPGTIAVNRLAAGWLPLTSVTVADGAGTFPLVPSDAAEGPRVLVLPIDDARFLTVEALANTGFDSHLPRSGIVVHEIDQSPTACRSGADTPCLNEYRSQLPISGTRPFTDLLGDGSTWSGRGWSISVSSSGNGSWTVSVNRSA